MPTLFHFVIFIPFSEINLGQGSVKKKKKWNGAILLSTKFSICDSKFIGGAEGSMMHNMES